MLRFVQEIQNKGPELLPARWVTLTENVQLPATHLIPDSHYFPSGVPTMEKNTSKALNNLMVCFSCELFVLFEEYLIRYIERNTVNLNHSTKALEKFVDEEVHHQLAGVPQDIGRV